MRNHIRAVGLTMQVCDDIGGLQDGYVAKMLHPDAPSGRQARWETLQLLLDAIYPGGVRLRIYPIAGSAAIRATINRKLARSGQMLSGASINEREAQKGLLGRVAIRDLARDAARKGALSRNARLTAAQRRRLARRTARARWKRYHSMTALTRNVSSKPAERTEIARDAARARWRQNHSAAP